MDDGHSLDDGHVPDALEGPDDGRVLDDGPTFDDGFRQVPFIGTNNLPTWIFHVSSDLNWNIKWLEIKTLL